MPLKEGCRDEEQTKRAPAMTGQSWDFFPFRFLFIAVALFLSFPGGEPHRSGLLTTYPRGEGDGGEEQKEARVCGRGPSGRSSDAGDTRTGWRKKKTGVVAADIMYADFQGLARALSSQEAGQGEDYFLNVFRMPECGPLLFDTTLYIHYLNYNLELAIILRF